MLKQSENRPAMFVWSNYWEQGRYGMYSPLGDAKVHEVVQIAGWSFCISNNALTAELSDTMVRDIIGDAIERQLWAR